MKGDKRGISAIVATVLIILITVAAVTIIWSAIIPMIRGNLSIDDPNIRLEIDTAGGYTVYDETNKQLYVKVSRGVDDADMTGLRIVVNINGTSIIYPNNPDFPDDAYEAPDPNQEKVYVLDVPEKPDTIRVIPLIINGAGVETEGTVFGELKSIPTSVSSGGSSSSTNTRDDNPPTPIDDATPITDISCVGKNVGDDCMVGSVDGICGSGDICLGEELVTNGGFTGDADDWALTTWTYNGGYINVYGAGDWGTYIATQDVGLVSGKTYNITYNMKTYYPDGGYYPIILGGNYVGVFASGINSIVATAGSTNGNITFQANNGEGYEGFALDDVSVREVLG